MLNGTDGGYIQGMKMSIEGGLGYTRRLVRVMETLKNGYARTLLDLA
jgi:hypothetical protein